MLFISVDLPTLGRPTMATIGSMLWIYTKMMKRSL